MSKVSPGNVGKMVKRTLVLTMLLLMVAAGLLVERQQRDARTWLTQLECLSPAEVDAALKVTVREGEPGLERVVHAMRSRHAWIVSAAATILNDALHEERASVESRRDRQRLVARELALNVETFSPHAQGLAADLVTTILRQNHRAASDEQPELLTACEWVIHNAPRHADLAALADDSQANGVTHPSGVETAPSGSNIRTVFIATDPRLAPLPGGVVADQDTNHDASVAVAEPEPLEVAPDEVLQPVPTEAAPEVAIHESDPKHPLRQGVARAAREEDVALQEPARLEVVADATDQADPIALAEQLHAADTNRVRAAAAALQQMGFSTREIEVAKRLTDPNPEVRIQWLRLLPGLNGFDARPWLLWFSRDEEVRVRKAAMGFMATTQDATLRARVSEMARTDSDPQVREQAAKIVGGGNR